jgi:hypothetical protein
MPVVVAMLIVIPHHTTVVTPMQGMVDVSQVIPSHRARNVNPDLPAELSIATLKGNVVNIVDDLLVSHDLFYHG